jgi:hypothetical protein
MTSRVSRNWRWALPALLAGLAGCGYTSTPSGAGTSASINLKLKTVPIVRSVTVSPGAANFGACNGGKALNNTQSTNSKLGFPNGQCFVGSLGRSFPITITNTGIASDIDINGANAMPSDLGDQWSLCNRGLNPFVRCRGRNFFWPGNDQYLVQNFGPYKENRSGVTDNPACDHEFDPDGRCYALQGAEETEGIELTGPSGSTDTSTSWTVTITWTPVP